MISLALELVRLANAIGKLERVVEDEIVIVIVVDRQWRIIGAGQARGLAAGTVEDLILAVERNREEGFRSPLKGLLLAAR